MPATMVEGPREPTRTEDDPWYPLATRIRTERVGSGLSARELAERVGCSRATIHNWESGRPVPPEKCVRLAEALSLDPAELLSLHPGATPAVATSPVTDRPSAPRTARRAWLVIAVLSLTVYVTWATATADCLEVGAGGGSMIGPFREAYERYGGPVVLGCPTNEVHKWGPGYAQDLSGGVAGESVLVTLDRRAVRILPGPARHDFYAIAGVATTDFTGVAVSDPLVCGPAALILLDGGLDGPGALVTATGGRWVWIPADFWAVYEGNGGPAGPLGLPGGPIEPIPGGRRLGFEGGVLAEEWGGPVVAEPPIRTSVPAFDVAGCAPADIERLVLGDIPADRP